MKVIVLLLANLLVFTSCDSSDSKKKNTPPKIEPVITPLTQEQKDIGLNEAAIKGNLSEVTRLLNEGADPNYEYFEEAPLYNAIINNHLDVAELLIQNFAEMRDDSDYSLPYKILNSYYYPNIYNLQQNKPFKDSVIQYETGITAQERINRDLNVFDKLLGWGANPAYQIEYSIFSSIFSYAMVIDASLADAGFESSFTKILVSHGFKLEQLKINDYQQDNLPDISDMIGSDLIRRFANFQVYQNHDDDSPGKTLSLPVLKKFLELFDILKKLGADFSHDKWTIGNAIFLLDPNVFRQWFTHVKNWGWSLGPSKEGFHVLAEVALYQSCALRDRSSNPASDLGCMEYILINIETFYEISVSQIEDSERMKFARFMTNFGAYDNDILLLGLRKKNPMTAQFIELMLTLGADTSGLMQECNNEYRDLITKLLPDWKKIAADAEKGLYLERYKKKYYPEQN